MTPSNRNHSVQRVIPATTLTLAAILAPGLGLAHETGAPHGAVEHMALYVAAAALLAVAGVLIARSTRSRAERRVRVEKDDHRR